MSLTRLRLSTITPSAPPPETPGRTANSSPAAKLQFLASLNHEIRTPLSGILGMADLLLETELDSDQREYVNGARQCAAGLFDLLNETLEYTSIASGTVELDESELDLVDALTTALGTLRADASAAGHQIDFTPPQNLPATVIGDAYRLRQVLTLLSQHAVRATTAGSIAVSTAWLAQPGRQGTLLLVVSSRQESTTDASVRAVFESFEQLENGATRRFDGRGLGLALLRRVVGLLSGDIILECGPDHLCTMTAEIPLRLPGPTLVATPNRGASHRAAGQRILIVEDNRISQRVLTAILAKRQHAFDCAADGPSAIAAAAACPYQLILMDLYMPGMDGLETTRRIRCLPGYADVPILALTAEVSDQVRALCRQSGMAAFLNKPVDAAELLATVERFLLLRD